MHHNLNKFDPIKGIETHYHRRTIFYLRRHLNKFDPIKGIETLATQANTVALPI